MISVIVPVYNVEPYLRRCLDSLAAQTFSDVEFILVDDGSTDGSGLILDAYSDPRFRVYHTENRGLSAARNLGIDKARGDWLMFADADDRAAAGFCEIPWRAAVESGADLVIFQYYYEKNGRLQKSRGSKDRIENADFITAFECGRYTIWNKLFRRELFRSIRFPEGRVSEDIAIAGKIIQQAKHVLCLPDRLYYYIYRPDSISHTYTAANVRDRFLSVQECNQDLAALGYPAEKLDAYLCSAALGLLASTPPSDNDRYYLEARKIADSTKKIPKEFSFMKKAGFVVWKTDKRLFYLICRLSGRMPEA